MDPKIEVVYEACFGKREYGPCLAKPLPMPARAKVKWGTWKMETILPRVNRYIEMMQNLNSKKLWVLVCDSIQLKDVIITDTCPFKSAHTNKSISWMLSQTYLGSPSKLPLSLSLSAGIDHIRGLLGVLPTQPRIWIKHPKKGALPQHNRNKNRVTKNCIIGYLDCFLLGTEQGE